MGSFSLYGGTLALNLPDTWDDRSIYTYVAPEQNVSAGMPTMNKTQGFRPNVVVTRESRGKYERLDAYAKDQLAASQKQLPQMKVVSEDPSTVGGQPAICRVFTFVAPPQNVTVQQMQTFVLIGDWIYTLTFSTLPSHFNEQKKMFDKIVGDVTSSGDVTSKG